MRPAGPAPMTTTRSPLANGRTVLRPGSLSGSDWLIRDSHRATGNRQAPVAGGSRTCTGLVGTGIPPQAVPKSCQRAIHVPIASCHIRNIVTIVSKLRGVVVTQHCCQNSTATNQELMLIRSCASLARGRRSRSSLSLCRAAQAARCRVEMLQARSSLHNDEEAHRLSMFVHSPYFASKLLDVKRQPPPTADG